MFQPHRLEGASGHERGRAAAVRGRREAAELGAAEGAAVDAHLVDAAVELKSPHSSTPLPST